MSTIQNLKNFIRHGKQARAGTPHGEPTTNVTAVHVERQRQPQAPQQQQQHAGLSGLDHKAAPAKYEQKYQQQVPAVDAKNGRNHEQEIEQIVAEEKLSKSTMPSYPGLERWILLEKMGDGAFSNVYRGPRQYWKIRRGCNQGRPQVRDERQTGLALWVHYASIMRQLDHPNIVKLIEFSESRQFYYIVLELCPGGELFHQIVRLTYFSENLSRHVIIQVAKAIEYLHETSGVVHRDIKPENLLFYSIPHIPTKNPKPPAPGEEDKVDEGEFIPGVGAGGIGVIKVADFGLSKVIWDSETMTPCGTVGYTAPEIVKDEKYSKSVDMWALGCVLYTLLCGFPPFYDESIQILTEKVARGQYTFLSPWWDDISKSAQDLVSHLLTVDPDKRYTIGEFLNHPWIRQTDEETYAADDAPPLATPLATQSHLLETPFSLTDRRADFRSPGAINLREVFDVGYAVHRQEEEAKRRKNFKQGYRGANVAGQYRGDLNPVAEDYDDDDYEEDEEMLYYDQENYAANTSSLPSKVRRTDAADVAGMESKLRATNLGSSQPSAAARARQTAAGAGQQQPQQRRHHQQYQTGGYGQHSAAVAAAARENAARSANQPFELSLDNATLLERRGRRLEGQAAS
ncbi:serine/threonine-protein kinase srk1 [Uncinocarpus reesii 1704]|uniref:Serine/threonine-protein kinase srk1 n=1 Tax=Uncinocarpus reesii (strain UAMH 1704) TaxID=336963 RepID=C4JJB9_UNCRE|nr:serine/threonine-protein kinase srk1 [Uncinocarpus reesii 1704]EEP76877.1 serine/threonine-protein kinase srk1 [Uncinocarpus reesii 1704]